LAAIGHPVLGDRRYGGVRGAMRVKRPMLHAAQLRLSHPESGTDVTFDAAAPEDFTRTLGGLS
ncbi:MAG: RluA family pseudouridine synthase, partial [Acidimicrobiales bacterium]